MAVLEMPVRSDFNAYTFSIDLENVIFNLSFKLNTRKGRWIMDIADSEDNDLVNGIPILIDIPLFDHFVKDGLPPGRFIAIDTTGEGKEPGRDDLGNDIKLFYEESA